MKKLSSLFAIAAVSALLSGCASLHNSGYPDSTSNKGKRVSASLNHFNIFLLVPPENMEKLMDDLSEQCGNNKVEGISWSDKRRFLFIGELVTIEVSGRCAE
jgi:hypothetical protein